MKKLRSVLKHIVYLEKDLGLDVIYKGGEKKNMRILLKSLTAIICKEYI